MNYYFQSMKTPIGEVQLVSDGEFLRELHFGQSFSKLQKKYPGLSEKKCEVLVEVKKQLKEYFSGKRRDFDLPLKIEGTEFQKKTWRALSQVPYGKTISYQDQAKAIRNPKAVRAVGRTNGLNPIGIIIPCHRVVGKSGDLTGYAGGLNIKEYLLNLEGVKSNQRRLL